MNLQLVDLLAKTKKLSLQNCVAKWSTFNVLAKREYHHR